MLLFFSLGSKRFIIKEGYAAEYCYLIIVGSGMCVIFDILMMQQSYYNKLHNVGFI